MADTVDLIFADLIGDLSNTNSGMCQYPQRKEVNKDSSEECNAVLSNPIIFSSIGKELEHNEEEDEHQSKPRQEMPITRSINAGDGTDIAFPLPERAPDVVNVAPGMSTNFLKTRASTKLPSPLDWMMDFKIDEDEVSVDLMRKDDDLKPSTSAKNHEQSIQIAKKKSPLNASNTKRSALKFSNTSTFDLCGMP